MDKNGSGISGQREKIKNRCFIINTRGPVHKIRAGRGGGLSPDCERAQVMLRDPTGASLGPGKTQELASWGGTLGGL